MSQSHSTPAPLTGAPLLLRTLQQPLAAGIVGGVKVKATLNEVLPIQDTQDVGNTTADVKQLN